MARQQQQDAQQNFKTSQGIESTASGNSSSLYNSLFPQYESEATNPQGFTPEEKASMATADQQSIGGSTAGAVGEGDLEAARTGNEGGFTPALDESVRSGERTLSQDALGVENEDALLKQSNKQAGIAGEQSLYGENQGEELGALGQGNSAVNAGTTAGQSGWFQNMTALINSLKPGGSVGGGQPASASIGGG